MNTDRLRKIGAALTDSWSAASPMKNARPMGMEEGMKEAMGQIDAILAEG